MAVGGIQQSTKKGGWWLVARNSDAIVGLLVGRALAVAGQWGGCGNDSSSSNGSRGGSFGG
jgi:hypothetical protein